MKASTKPSKPGLARHGDLLARAELFSSFSKDEIDYLAERCELLSLAEGDLLFSPGDPASSFYVVASGSVVIHSPEGGSAMAEFVAGDSLGELEFLTGARRNAVARAGEGTVLLSFPPRGLGLRQALAERPAVAARVYRSFLLVVAGRTRKANALVKENSPLVRELKRQVYGDKLTGLLNKAWLEENLPALLKEGLGLLMLKPDNFKEINDSFGHEVGDAVLVAMAADFGQALGGLCQGRAQAVRYMGNELAAVLPGLDRPSSLEAARALKERLEALDISALTGEKNLRLSISMGLVLGPEHGKDPETMIKLAAGLPLVGRARGGSIILFPEDAP